MCAPGSNVFLLRGALRVSVGESEEAGGLCADLGYQPATHNPLSALKRTLAE